MEVFERMVAVVDLKDVEGREVISEIAAFGGTGMFYHLDVTNEARVFASVAAEFGGIDILVNNAGISCMDKPTHEVTEKEWDEVMDVNVKGVFLCTKHAIPHMLRTGGGSIINLSSIYGLVGAADIP
jgi:NAD(P)-dependent dehydrogenase (short-subunit alcohol dehydrogenase family)